MGFPASVLGEGESVALDLRPHWRRLVRPLLAVPVLIGAGSYGAAVLPAGRLQADARWAVLAAVVILLLALSLRPWLRWHTTRYLVTNRRVVVRAGVLSRRGRDMPLARITDVSFTRTLLERLVGAGTLVLESAGERGQLIWTDVPDVERVQATIYRLTEEADRHAGSRAGSRFVSVDEDLDPPAEEGW